MALREDTVTLGDVARELSPETVDYFSQLQIEGISHAAGLVGKFVRLENVIVIAPQLKVWVGAFRKPVEHRDLMGHALEDMGREISGRVETAEPHDDAYLLRAWHLVDAGHYRIGVDADARPNRFVLDGESIGYGRPEDAVRQATAALAQTILGHEIQVEAE